ncbi:MAG: hypothetical protein ACYS99_13720 [Planctomycetota bacterium]
MSRRRSWVLLAGILVAGAMGLCPPWVRYHLSTGQEIDFAGFHLFWSPPQPAPSTYRLGSEGEGFRSTEAFRIDRFRLLFLWGVVVLLTLAASLGRRDRRRAVAKAPPGGSYHRSRVFGPDE